MLRFFVSGDARADVGLQAHAARAPGGAAEAGGALQGRRGGTQGAARPRVRRAVAAAVARPRAAAGNVPTSLI